MNQQLVELLIERFKVADTIAKKKRSQKMPITNPAREDQVLKQVTDLAKESGYSEYIKNIFIKIIDETSRSEEK